MFAHCLRVKFACRNSPADIGRANSCLGKKNEPETKSAISPHSGGRNLEPEIGSPKSPALDTSCTSYLPTGGIRISKSYSEKNAESPLSIERFFIVVFRSAKEKRYATFAERKTTLAPPAS